MLLKLAWRNIWRNKRRTLLTIGATTFAVFFASFMNSFQKGAWDHMMFNVVNSYFGYGQIHEQGYWEEQSLDKAFDDKEALAKANAINEVRGTVSRVESYALASFGKYTKVAFVIGTPPEAENNLTKLKTRVSAGEYLSENDQAVMVGKEIAKKLKMNVGDTVVLLGQGYHGVNAAGKFLVKGLLDFPSPDLNRRMVYMPLKTAHEFYGTEGKVTTMALNIGDKETAVPVLASLKKDLDKEKYEVMSWQEMLPELQQAREIDTAGSLIMLFVLYVIITFVLLGTILMLTKERMHEFGILTAIGMNKKKLAGSVWLEIVILGFVGTLVGILLGAALVYYFHVNPLDLAIMGEDAVKTYENFGVEPIFPAAFEWQIFFNQAVLVFVLMSILAIYPIVKILRLDSIQAMRD